MVNMEKVKGGQFSQPKKSLWLVIVF